MNQIIYAFQNDNDTVFAYNSEDALNICKEIYGVGYPEEYDDGNFEPLDGELICASILSSVDLPAPLWPMMPTTSPRSIEKLTSSRALNSGRSGTALPVRRAPVFKTVCLRLCRAPRRYSLVRRSTSMTGIGEPQMTSAKWLSARLKYR